MAERKPLFTNDGGPDEEMATTDTATFGGLTISSAAGIAMGGFKITNLGVATVGTDAVNLDLVNSLVAIAVTGFDPKASVRLKTVAALPAFTAAGTGVGKTLTATANGALSVDGVAVAVGDGILYAIDATSDVNHGFYSVTAAGGAGAPYVLTRRADADQNTEVTAGAYVFVTEGTQAETGWVLKTNDPIVVDTTALEFVQFTGTGSIVAGAGILKTGSTLDVELDTGAAAQTGGTGGGSSGLEFDVAGAAGKLRAAVTATGGLQRLGTGLAARLNGTTLASGALGLSVLGLPSLYEINGVAVSANVTAANENSLVDGNPVLGLHFHRDTKFTATVNESIAVGDPVCPSTVADRVDKAQAGTDSKRFVIGVAETAQVTAGGTARVVSGGVATGVLAGATAGQRFYLGATGGLTAANTPPGAGNNQVLVLIAKNATDAWYVLREYVKKAA